MRVRMLRTEERTLEVFWTHHHLLMDGWSSPMLAIEVLRLPGPHFAIETRPRECAEAIAAVIHGDTGLPDEQSRLLSVSLVGMAQVSARFWLDTDGEIPQRDAAGLVSALAWRGIRGFPRTDDPS